MRHYGMGYGEVLSLPVRVFWMLNVSINRLMAEEDLRSISVAMMSQSSEGFEAKNKNLVIEMGEMFIAEDQSPLNDVRDEDGFAELKLMM